MKQKTVIIGGNGFIGSNLSSYLLKKNFKIRILDKFINTKNNFTENLSEIDFIECDISNTSELINNIGDFENIIWLVHTSVPSNSMLDLSDDLFSNLDPLIKFLSRIKDTPNIERFIFLSSGGTIYGDPKEFKPIVEDHSINPISNYGLTKYTQEKYIHLILKQSNIDTYILRPANVYGPNQNLNKPQGIIGHALKAAINDHPISLFNNGQIIRDFLFADDLSAAIHKCLIASIDSSSIESYNLGSEVGISIQEIIEIIRNITQKELNLILKPPRPFDCAYNVLDSSKFKAISNWEAKTTIDEGIMKVYKWIVNTNI